MDEALEWNAAREAVAKQAEKGLQLASEKGAGKALEFKRVLQLLDGME